MEYNIRFQLGYYRSLLWKLQRKSADTFNLTFAKQSKAEQWHSWFCDCLHWLTPRCNAQRRSCTYIHIPPTRQAYVLHTPWFADPIVTILLSLHSLPWYFFYYCQLINTISIIPLLWCCMVWESCCRIWMYFYPRCTWLKVRCWSHCNKSEVARLNTPQWRIIPMISGWKSIMWWAGRWRPDILSTLWHGKWNQLMEKPFEV